MSKHKLCVVMSVLALVGSGVARAQADCTRPPDCDPLNSSCWTCDEEEPLTGWEAGDSADTPVLAEFGRSMGSDRGGALWIAIRDTMAEVPVTIPARSANFDDEARDSVTQQGNDGRLRDLAAQGRASGDNVLTRWGAVFASGVAVPRPQGTTRDAGPDGVARSADPDGRLADPIDPITGELIVEHDDLSLPSFGVPFAHRRIYRSRMDYDGPLGPGWDFAYNQRLFETPHVAPDAPPGPPSSPPPSGGRHGLPVADVPPLEIGQATEACGPVLLLTTGNGTTLRFREEAVVDTVISYSSGAPELTLRGHVAGDETSWSLTSRTGDVRRFDALGHLVAWVDPNGIGVTFQWEPADGPRGWRIAHAIDSVGRTISFAYDGADRLVRVSDAGSGLSATYEYAAHGGLERAVRADGRSERYQYDVQAGRERGEWIPERMLAAACTAACSPSSSSCDAGGACDAAITAATNACVDSCPACFEECGAACPGLCDDACRSGPGGCEGTCESTCNDPAHIETMLDNCREFYDSSGADDVCHDCRQECDRLGTRTCASLFTCVSVTSDGETTTVTTDGECVIWDQALDGLEDLGRGIYALFGGIAHTVWCLAVRLLGGECDFDSWWNNIDQLCDYTADICCTTGNDCARTSCNRGLACEDTCEAAFLGYGDAGRCPAPVTPEGCGMWFPNGTPSPSSPEYQDFLECTGDATEWSRRAGCLPRSRELCDQGCTSSCVSACREPCQDSCESTCFTECRVADCGSYCVELDLPGTCVDACTDACVDDMHARGPVPGPKYGYTADLQFNLVKVYDGNGDLYLENSYEPDVTSPNFDTVITQRYGEHTAEMQHVDLAHGDHTTAWAAGLVESPGDYDAPTICHYGCEVTPPDPRDVAVPWNDVVLVFSSGDSEELPPGGWSADLSNDELERSLAPVHISIDPTNGARIAPRAVRSELQKVTSTVDLSLPGGRVVLEIDADGTVSISGDDAVVAEVAAAGGVTLFGDGAMLRAYPGAPRAVVALADGRCTAPFHLARVADDRLEISPADACDDSVLFVPVAGPAVGLDATDFHGAGQDAIVRSYLTPSALVPTRAPVTMTRREEGIYALAAAPSDSGVKEALAASQQLYKHAPLFSVPDPAPPMVPAPDEIIYIFHQDTGSKPGDSYPPSLPPTDAPWWLDDHPDTVFDPPCDPTVPVPVTWSDGVSGPGAKPVYASAVRDLHGARWTFYADARGQVIRTVNHDTGASRWFEHDPDGRVTGVLEPDGARQCLRYDDRGNVAEVLALAAPVAGLATPDPIRMRYGWTDGPARLQSIVDPRDATRLLQHREYDGNGNLQAIVAIDGARTTVTPVGGSGPARTMPRQVIGPDGSVTQFAYDVSNGTTRSVTRDAMGPSPVVAEIQSDAAGRPTWMLSPLGLIETLDWDGPVLAERTWDADGLVRTEAYAHDDDAQLTAVTRGRQQVAMRYDVTGALFATERTALDASQPAVHGCRRMGAGGRVLEEVSGEGSRVRYAYDGEGRVTQVVAGDLGASAGPWDDTCLKDATGPSVAGTLATYEYDTSGRPRVMIDGRGLRTTWRYDGFGRQIVEQRPDGGRTLTGYDAVGQVVWQASYAPGGGQVYAPPQVGQPWLLAATEVAYDLRGRVDEVRHWHFDAFGVPVGDGISRTDYAYDELSRTVVVHDDLGRTTRARLDGAGRGVQVTLPDGSTIATAYLDGGRTIRTSRTAVGGTVIEYTTLTAAGQVDETSIVAGATTRSLGTTAWLDPFLPGETTSASGVNTTFAYDAFDRVNATSVGVPGGVGEQLEVTFDRESRPVARRSVAVPGQAPATWSFKYDALGRLYSETDPAGAATVTEYLGATSFPRVSTDPRQVRTTMTFADGGWLQSALVDAPGGGPDISLTYTHDALGRMVIARRQDGASTPVHSQFRWDSLGNLALEFDDVTGDAVRRAHTYDGTGQRVGTTFAGHAAARTFDALGRQTSLALDGASPATATWTYDAPGGPKVRRLVNGVETRYGYDKLSRLTSVSEWHTGAALAIHEWQLPLDGVPRQLSSQRSELPAATSVFAIDGLGRLTAEESLTIAHLSLDALDPVAPATADALAAMTSGRTSYDLDGRNNWLSRTVASATTSFERDARDALTAIGATPIPTDAAGTMTGTGSATYTFDALGQLAEVHPSTGVGRAYQRDALGRVVSETDTSTGVVTRHGYDGAQRILSADPSGALSLTFAAEGLDTPVVTLHSGGGRTYYHQERQSSVYALTDTSGNPTRWISYTAYGEPTLHDGAGRLLPPSASLNTFGYHGLPHDFALGLVDMRARAYAPSLGRFLSPDPIGLGGGSNLFAFVDSSPLAWRDPFGLEKEYLKVFDRVDINNNGAIGLLEVLAFTECSTDSAVTAAFGRLRTGWLWNRGRTISDDSYRLMTLELLQRYRGGSVGGLNQLVDDQRTRWGSELTTGPLGAMSSNRYDELEREISVQVNLSALTGGPFGSIFQAMGMPEVGIIVNDLAVVAHGGMEMRANVRSVQTSSGRGDYVEARDRPARHAGPYMPIDRDRNYVPFASQRVQGLDIPLPHPGARGPHTVLGVRLGSHGEFYRQSASFHGPSFPLANGVSVPMSRVDWTNHGTPHHHPNPHRHVFMYNWAQKRWERSRQQPVSATPMGY